MCNWAVERTIPSVYGTLLLQPPWSWIGATLGGTPGAPGAGGASVTSGIPNELALLGLRVDFQEGVLDPAAMHHVPLTNGLELWIL